jgi:hypothetical protein
MKIRLLTVLVVLTALFLLSASIVWAAPLSLAKTGQTLCYLDNGTETDCTGTGQDGEYQKGVASPDPRFTDNFDGTVTDNLTGLMWAKNASATGATNWYAAIDYANNLTMGTMCGIAHTDWRLPNVRELHSLIDFSNSSPALPTGHLFTNLISSGYWSSNFSPDISRYNRAWLVSMSGGTVSVDHTHLSFYVWPVRGGN